MPVQAVTRANRYTGNGVTTQFAYGFKILNQAHVRVKVAGVTKVLTTDYTVSGVGAANGGNITFVTAPANAATVTILGNTPYARTTFDYQRNGNFLEETVDADIDTIVTMIQQLAELLGRAPSLGETSNYSGLSVPDPESGKLLQWKGDLSGLQNVDFASLLPSGTAAVSTFVATLLDDADSTAFLGTLQFLSGATGAVTRSLYGKLKESISAFDFMTAAEIADVSGFTGAIDVTTKLQASLDYGANNGFAVHWPAGKYKITEPLWATPEGSVFKCAYIFGDGGGYAAGNRKTYIDASSIIAKPAIVFQKVRGSYLGHMQIEGGSKDLSAVTVDNFTYSYDYIGGTVRDSRYSPYCGVAIDAGVGATPPDGGYSGFTYQNSTGGSSNVLIEDVVLRRFVVGFMHNPESSVGATQGDMVTLLNCNIINTKIAIANGQSQARCFNVIGGNIAFCRSPYSDLDYGKQQGCGAAFFGTQIVATFEMFQRSVGFGTLSMYRVRCEETHRIGQSGSGAVTTAYPALLVDCDINLLSPSTGKRCPIVYESASSSLKMIGGYISDGVGTSLETLNIIAEPSVFENVMFRVANRFRPYVGCALNFNTPAILKSCRNIDASAAVNLGTEVRRYYMSGRITEHWSAKPRHAGAALYDFVAGNDNTYINVATSSAFVFTDTTLTFNLTTVTSLLAGDILFWQFLAIGSSSALQILPGLKVTSIVGTTVTCSLLYARAYYDESYAPSSMPVLVHEWAPGQALTADAANTSPTLANVSPTTILQNGDWIKGTGIPANTRVVSGGGTATVTMSKNATATNVGISVYFGRIHTITTAAAW